MSRGFRVGDDFFQIGGKIFIESGTRIASICDRDAFIDSAASGLWHLDSSHCAVILLHHNFNAVPDFFENGVKILGKLGLAHAEWHHLP